MGYGSHNSFDYKNNSFNKSGPFEVHKFNSFLNVPKINFQVSLEFIEDLQAIKKIRAKKELLLKLRILFICLLSILSIVFAFAV